MLLKFNNLTIRNADAGDAEKLAEWWNDGAVMAHAGFPLGVGTTAEEIAESLKNDTDDTQRRLIIEIDGIKSGEMNYRNKGNGSAEIGIKICTPENRDRGYGKVLLSMLISSLFNDLGYKKIILDTNLNNIRAQHVYERLGFKKVRVRENSWKNQLGELQSSIDYELYPENFINFAI
jgi:RimJ/RimL family protein N-acetyltransferase